MKKCKYCKDFNEEKHDITIDEIRIQGSYFHYNCPIKFCPSCGTILKKYKQSTCQMCYEQPAINGESLCEECKKTNED